MELLPSGAVHAWLYGAKDTRFDYGAHTVSVPRNWTPDFRAEGIRGTEYLANLYVGAAEVAATYYDALDRRVSSTMPGGGKSTYAYDTLGRVTSRLHPDAGRRDPVQVRRPRAPALLAGRAPEGREEGHLHRI